MPPRRLVLRASAPGVDDRQDRAASRLLRQARAVGLRAGAAARAGLLRPWPGREDGISSGSAARGLTDPALMNSVQKGETHRGREGAARKAGRGTRRDASQACSEARRQQRNDHARDRRRRRCAFRPPEHQPARPTAATRSPRIYEFEVYGADGRQNLALGRPATGSAPCSPDRGPGEGRERQRRRRESRQLVRRGLALLPAGGSWRGASGEALRREARQRRWRKRGARHPRLQHPGEHGRQDVHHRRDVFRRRLRRRTDRVSHAHLLRRPAGGPVHVRRRQAGLLEHRITR